MQVFHLDNHLAELVRAASGLSPEAIRSLVVQARILATAPSGTSRVRAVPADELEVPPLAPPDRQTKRWR
ncbi:MAG: hypothetical protein ACJ8H8_01050 [Geminicoccaceae bacterium]